MVVANSTYITGSGVYTPPNSISNEELVNSFNNWVDLHNEVHKHAIELGQTQAKSYSSTEFIEKASGIKSRFVVNKEGILDPNRMAPLIPERSNAEPSVMCEIACKAAEEALRRAGLEANQIDATIVAASNLQRAYPAIAIEVQAQLGISGFAFDMNVACSSATFAIQQARDTIRSGSAKKVLIVNPEICTGHLNFRDRDSHFIFGDVATALIIEPNESRKTASFEILNTRLSTIFSNNIRNNFGFLNRADESGTNSQDKLFVQEGRKVFKEICPAVANHISSQLMMMKRTPSELQRLWLHQANQNMNDLIARRVFGREPIEDEAPSILDQYANTSSAGSIIAFHQYREDLEPGNLGVLCSFGAGYSIGSILLKRC